MFFGECHLCESSELELGRAHARHVGTWKAVQCQQACSSKVLDSKRDSGITFVGAGTTSLGQKLSAGIHEPGAHAEDVVVNL